MSKHKVIFGDSREVLQDIESESVSLVVTSPPYFVGREYETYVLTNEHVVIDGRRILLYD